MTARTRRVYRLTVAALAVVVIAVVLTSLLVHLAVTRT